MTTDEQQFLEQKIEALQHTERHQYVLDNPFMALEEATTLSKQIKREYPGLVASVQPCEPPYAGSYFVDVTQRFHMVIRSPEQWQERKKDIRKVQ